MQFSLFSPEMSIVLDHRILNTVIYEDFFLKPLFIFFLSAFLVFRVIALSGVLRQSNRIFTLVFTASEFFLTDGTC